MSEVSRLVALDRIGAARFEVVVEAKPEELEPLARRLLIPAVHRMHCAFRLRRVDADVIEAEGLLEAEVVQTCAVSSEPIVQDVSDVFELQFVPAGSEAAEDDLEAPDQIPYSGHALDLGEAAVEQLALALEPYPRKPETDEAMPEDAKPPSAFAALAALRRKQ